MILRLFTISLLLFPVSGWGANITSKVVTGNLSTATNWVGDVAPVDGDTITVPSGADIAIDRDIILGSNLSGVGHAITINATGASSYGKISLLAGVSLTLRGIDSTSNSLMLVNRYGVFEALPGSIIKGDVATDYASTILNKGIFKAVGAAGNLVKFTVPAANVDWSIAVNNESKTSGAIYSLGPNSNIYSFKLGSLWVSNAAGTSVGSFGDSSLSVSAKNPATILQSEVETIAELVSAGKYYVDYNKGILYYYGYSVNDTCTVSYKTLKYKGWGIASVQDTTYNYAEFDYCDFSYMGSANSSLSLYSGEGLVVRYKNSTDASRNFKLTNSIIDRSSRFLVINNVNGSSENYIKLTSNTIRSVLAPANRGGFLFSAGPTSYIRIGGSSLDYSSNNLLAGLVTSSSATAGMTNTHYSIGNNTGVADVLIVCGFSYVDWAGLNIDHNTLLMTGTVNTNVFNTVGSSDPNNLVSIKSNTISNAFRIGNVSSNTVVEYNTTIGAYHHGWYFGSTSVFSNKKKMSNIKIRRNIATGRYNDAGFFHFGYTNYLWLDDIEVSNNTFKPTEGPSNVPVVNWIDPVDSGVGVLATNVKMLNNIVVDSPGVAVSRRADTTTTRGRFHVPLYGYNGFYNNAIGNYSGMTGGIFLKSGANYNTGTRNVSGVALANPSYTLPETTHRSLVWDATAKTLKWGDGDPVSIKMPSQGDGTITSFTTGEYNTVINDTGRTWSTLLNNSANPTAYWLHHPASGKTYAVVKTESATQITVAPVMSPAPTNGDAYVLYQSEVTLFDTVGGTGGSVSAGIYYADLPVADATDTAITIGDFDVVTNPGLNSIYAPTNQDYDTSGYGGTYIGAMDVVTIGNPAALLMVQ